MPIVRPDRANLLDPIANLFRNQLTQPTIAFELRLVKPLVVIVKLANSDEVPVRLILGVDAEKRVQQAEAARPNEAAKWRDLTVSTVFEDGGFDRRLYMANSGMDS